MQIYYVTIRAASDTGSVDVSSDGVIILQEGVNPSGADVFDGIGCTDYEESKILLISRNDAFSVRINLLTVSRYDVCPDHSAFG